MIELIKNDVYCSYLNLPITVAQWSLLGKTIIPLVLITLYKFC